MRKLLLSISALCALLVLVSFTGTPVNGYRLSLVGVSPGTVSINTTASLLYSSLELDKKGLSEEAFEYAWKGYEKLAAGNRLGNIQYLTICDFSQSSKRKRLYLIDVTNRLIVMNTWVAHGRNSGLEFATKFSNTPESLQSSLGFYRTQRTYTGEHGLSLRVEGLEPGFNDKAMERAIVIHGADYISASRASSGFIGRSYGCPAVASQESAILIKLIKNGSCLFIYHPTKKYLNSSKILND